MGTLGVGVRVWVGWAYSRSIEHYPEDPRLRYATIVEGAWRPGEPYRNALGILCRCPTWTKWRVQYDTGWRCMVAEFLLTPVGDGDEDAETDAERETDPEVECSAS